jgi:protein subunit release factor A
MKITDKDIYITLCKSESTNYLSAEVGVKIRHINTGIIVSSTEFKSQHKNKIEALKLLNVKLEKQEC